MMARVRYRAMYATSTAVGMLLWFVMAAVGGGRVHGARALIRQTARKHAIDAARKRGPYLAPVTMWGGLAGMTLFGALLINRMTS
jgi:hypothetical protein